MEIILAGIIILPTAGILAAMFVTGLFCSALEFIQWAQQTVEDYRQDRRRTE